LGVNTERRRYAFPFLCVLFGWLGWRSLAATFSLAWTDDQYTQILLIPPVVAALTYLEWPLPQTFALANLRRASGLIGVLVLGLAAEWKLNSLPADQRLALSMCLLVFAWIVAFIICFGPQAARKMLFPLCFLFWLVPLPHFLMDRIVTVLQHWSADCARILFAVARVPVRQDGVLLTIPGLTLEVAEECSSIRSSLMLLVTTMVLAQLLLRSPWRKAILVAAVIPLSAAKNGLRIFVLGMLGTYVDGSYLNGRLHRQGGIIYFLIALLAIGLLLWLLRRGEPAYAVDSEKT
jgi:exosortase